MTQQTINLMKRAITRRAFFRWCAYAIGTFGFLKFFPRALFAQSPASNARVSRSVQGAYDIVVAEGDNARQNVRQAIEAMGGIRRFVKKGDIVVVKPNMAWDRTPAQAANTNPQVVAAVVSLCYEAGAKRVNVFDITCNDARRVYERSGIKKTAEDAGAYVYFAEDWNVEKAHFAHKSPLEGWPIQKDALTCDVFINVPIVKHHGLTELTLSMKNLMGVCGGKRGFIHIDIGEKLVDLAGLINPDLTVMDATRVLVRHGPQGGQLEDVVTMNTVFVATDPTLADTYAAQLLDKDPLSVPYLKVAALRGFGSTDVKNARIFHTKQT